MSYILGKNTTRNLETLLNSGKASSHILVCAVKEFIKYTPIDFCVLPSGGYRTEEEQLEIFSRKASKCDGIIVRSKHQSGLAVDLVPWVDEKATWKDGQGERKHAFYLAGAFLAFCKMKGIPVTSGADWNRDGNLKDGWDPCHMQIEEF